MSIIRTERATVLWAPESAYGVYAAASKRFGIHDTIVAPDPELNWRPVWDVGHTSRSRRTILRGKWSLKGSVPDILLQPTASARELMSMALGQTGTGWVMEGLSGGVNATDHRLPSFTTQVLYHDTDGQGKLGRTYVGCKINRATWSAREGEELRFSVDDFIAQTVFTALDGTRHSDQGNQFIIGMENRDPGPSDTGRYIFGGADIKLTIAGADLHLAHTRSFRLTIDNQLDPKYYLNRADTGNFMQILSQIVEGKRAYTCDIEVDLQDPSTDLALWGYLVNEGGPGGGKPTGCSITAAFESEFQEGAAPHQLVLACDSSPTTLTVGAVLKAAAHGIPAPPAGLVPIPLAFDVGRVAIISSV